MTAPPLNHAMKSRSLCLLFAFAVFGLGSSFSAAEKLRVLVLTDIENEPDDAMSMVRFLVYANHWDVEGLVATTSIHQQNKTAAWRIRNRRGLRQGPGQS